MARATRAGNQKQDPHFRPRGPGESSKPRNKASFDPGTGYSTKYFVPYLCCCSQRDKFQGWLGKKGLLILRPGVIYPSWALLGLRPLKGRLDFSRMWFRLGEMGSLRSGEKTDSKSLLLERPAECQQPPWWEV